MNKLIFDRKQTYLALIKNSIGSSMFKSCYFKDSKSQLVDVCKDGEFPCAFYASNILKIIDLVEIAHVTVDSLVTEMERCGWCITKTLSRGAVLIWEARIKVDGEPHRHVGFFVGDHRDDNCVSFVDGIVKSHNLFVGKENRWIEKIYFHPGLILN